MPARLPRPGRRRRLTAPDEDRRPATGEVHDVPVGLVHEVGNDDDGPARRIHVYSPPLRAMTRYDARSLVAMVTLAHPAAA